MENQEQDFRPRPAKYQSSSQPPARRQPLGEATRRVNNTQTQYAIPSLKTPSVPIREGLRRDDSRQGFNASRLSPEARGGGAAVRGSRPVSAYPTITNPRHSAISKEETTESKRSSQVSTASTNASDGNRVKSHIGPWRLGKTLGKGATARVRLARHAYTGQEAAIKIVQKKNAQISQAGSLAALDKAESRVPDSTDGMRRMPVGIEREVAIMKLIQHPNIMKLYDIWENRTEM